MAGRFFGQGGAVPAAGRKVGFPQVGAALPGALAALLPPPVVHRLVVAAEQDGRHRPALPHLGAGVLGVLQKAVPVAFFLIALLLGQHAGLQAQDAVRHHQAGQLAAGEDIIPDGDLLVGKGLDHPLVDPLVVAADQQQAVVLGQAAGMGLGVALAPGRHKHDMRGGAALLRHLPPDVPDAVGDGLGVQDHPAAAPVGVVVGLLLAVEGVIPDLVAVGLDVPPPGGPAQDALVQHPLAHLREQGRNVHTHPHQPSSRSLTPPSSSRPGMGVTVM